MKKAALLSIVIIFSLNLNAQSSTKSTSFWLAFMENLTLLFNDSPQFAVVISSDEATSGMISVPATGLEIPFSVEADTVTEILLPDAVWYSQVTEVIENKGVLIESELPIQAHAIHYRSYFTDGTRLLPASMLSSEYTVMAVGDLNNNSASSLVIVSTEVSTEVMITPSVLTQGLRPPGITFTITLDKGQIYQIQASSDLTGTRIESSGGEALAVFAGAQQADVYCQGDDSHLWDQLLPQSEWGIEYILVPYEGMSGDVFKILASQDSTTLNLNCNEIETLNAGESLELFVNDASRLISSAPIEVAQLNTGQNCNASPGGPSFMIIPPLNKQSILYRWEAPSTTEYFSSHIAHVVVNSNDVDDVLIDGESISFEVVDDFPAYSYARLSVNPGVHTLSADVPFWATAGGFGEADAYTFSLGWTLDIPVGLVDVSVVPDPNGSDFCPGDEIFFFYEYSDSFTIENWDFDNGQTAVGNSPTMIFDAPGIYNVQFQGINDEGCPIYGFLDLEIVDCDVISVSALNNEDQISWYCSNNELFFSNPSNQKNVELALYSLNGSLLWTERITEKNFRKSFSGFSAGVYILKAKTDFENKTSRLVIR